MMIKLGFNGTCGNTRVPAGDYLASLNAGAGEIILAGKGLTIALKAIRRRADARTKSTTVSFYSGGGNSWSLVVAAPKAGEWIATIDKEDG